MLFKHRKRLVIFMYNIPFSQNFLSLCNIPLHIFYRLPVVEPFKGPVSHLFRVNNRLCGVFKIEKLVLVFVSQSLLIESFDRSYNYNRNGRKWN